MKVSRGKNELTGAIFLILWTTLSFWVCGVTGLPGGAPDAACRNMTPDHSGSLPSNMDPPYSVEILDGVTTYSPGTPVQGTSNHLSFFSNKKF